MKIYQLIGRVTSLPGEVERTLCVTESRAELLTVQSQALGLWGYSFAELRVAEWMGGRRVRFVDLNGEPAL